MKESEAVKLWQEGHLVARVTYVGSSAETIRWRDNASGKALEAPVLKHSVVVGNGVGIVNERVPDTFKVEDYKPPFAPMSKCLLTYTSMEPNKGVPAFRGRLEPLTA